MKTYCKVFLTVIDKNIRKETNMAIKIGITERGDAALDFSWENALEKNTVNGVILITKNLTLDFCNKLLFWHRQNKNIILHATCTGWGGYYLEPNVPEYKTQITMLAQLIQNGFPKKRCVLRIDPIIPTTNGMFAVEQVLREANRQIGLKDLRVRISLLDEYPHVKRRIRKTGCKPFYNGFQPDKKQIQFVINNMEQMQFYYGITFECCAEDNLIGCAYDNSAVPNQKPIFEHIGCISEKDLKLFGLSVNGLTENPQHRTGCHCLSCKTELLNNKHPCSHDCLYCYWKKKGESF